MEVGLPRGSASYETGQKDVTTSATLLVPARPGRISVVISPMSAVNYCVGKSDVTMASGLFAANGAPITLDTAEDVYIIGASGFRTSYIEYV